MADSGRIYIFLDTNIALHFKRADEIDWCALLGRSEITIISAPIFLRELDEQKVQNHTRRLRERAANTGKWLASLVRGEQSSEIRRGVRIEFVTDEPAIDFAEARLSREVADDQLIATLIEFARARTGADVRVVTDDLLLELKLRSRGIGVVTLPDVARLPEEPDPVAKELQEARRQIARLQSRLPRLGVKFRGSSDRLSVHLQQPRHTLQGAAVEEKRRAYPKLPFPLARAREQDYRFAALTDSIINAGATREAVDEYNRNLEAYYEKYEGYLQKLATFIDQTARAVELKLDLENDGTATASNLDLILTFPPGIELTENDDLEKPPIEPQPPIRPGIFGAAQLAAQMGESRFSGIPGSLLRGPADHEGVPRVQGRCQANVSISKLKHGFKYEVRPLWLRFSSWETAGSMTINFHLSADELPAAEMGTLHLVVDLDR